VLSGRGLCDKLITCPEEYYRLWYVAVCDLETSWMRGSWPTGGSVAPKDKKHMCNIYSYEAFNSNKPLFLRPNITSYHLVTQHT
jgi:hypothetical protein